MQSKRRIYLDTSVVSALHDERNPERQSLTMEFFGRIKEFDVFISELTVAEIAATPKKQLRELMLATVSSFPVVEQTSQVEKLAEQLLAYQGVPASFSEDALHIAFAIVYDLDFLLSWNFKHIVRRKTKDVVRLVTGISGYKDVEIVTPPELL